MKPWMAALLTPVSWGLGWAAPKVAYVTNVAVHGDGANSAVVIAEVGADQTVSVSEGLRAAQHPAWSPDGQRLAFEAIEKGGADLFVCDADGANRRNVTASPATWETCPAFLPEGQTLLFLSGPDRTDVWSLDLASGQRKPLTHQPLFRSPLAVSRDGRTIAFAASEKLAGPGDLFVIPADGAELRKVTAAPAVYSAPCFSPDGMVLVFAFDGTDIGGTTRGIASTPVSSGPPTLLATDGDPHFSPCFSPDGTKIAYTSSPGYNTTWITVMNADGSNPQRLEVSPFHVIARPSFGPDSDTLAYHGSYAAVFTAHVVRLSDGQDLALPERNAVCPVFALGS
jgi:TolB protein